MLAKLHAAALIGIDAQPVEVEVDMALGLPFFNLVGLSDGAARESKVRVLAALKNAGYTLPSKRITVNLAPAGLRKEGPAFELPIAVGLLEAGRAVTSLRLDGTLLAGELSLDGRLKPIRGALALASVARARGLGGVVVPLENAEEAALVEGIDVYGAGHLIEVVQHLTGEVPLAATRPPAYEPDGTNPQHLDLADVRGQSDVKLALELAAAGGHAALMLGPPGSGKTMLARRLPSLLPPLTLDEALEVTRVHSAAGTLRGQRLVSERPFRAPHHTVSQAGLFGGGSNPRPGELSLAHHGVLFLDELPELRRAVLEGLRQPLESREIHLARSGQRVVYPCRTLVLAAMNPCPCGYFNVPDRACTCPPSVARGYLSRISGPLLDRFDITLQTRPVVSEALFQAPTGPSSSEIRERVMEARERQRVRFQGIDGVSTNAEMSRAQLERACRLDGPGERLLRGAMARHRLSARAHERILKLARTRADLDGADRLEARHVALALDCRVLDRPDFWEPLEPAVEHGTVTEREKAGINGVPGLV